MFVIFNVATIENTKALETSLMITTSALLMWQHSRFGNFKISISFLPLFVSLHAYITYHTSR
jgi:hypothetical protein